MFRLLVACLVATQLVPSRGSSLEAPPDDEEDEEMFQMRSDFEEFKVAYNKSYAGEEEENRRFQIFVENMKKAQMFEEDDRGTAEYGVTEFSDMSDEEFNQFYLNPLMMNDSSWMEEMARIPVAEPLPKCRIQRRMDWRQKGAVTVVKNQRRCSASWAFGCVANIESLSYIKTKQLKVLSEQELLDCDRYDKGCSGGFPFTGFYAVQRLGGLMSQRTYPYRGRKCRCKQARRKRVVKVKTFQCITPYELEMQRWVALRGPIVVSINAAMLKTYRHGIIRASSFRCSARRVNHVVCIVGYGYQRRKPYWILKNSWGRKWGENRRCSASWAFGCVANIESLSYIKTKQLKVLSEQELLDCDRYDKGCSGGFPFTGFYAVQRLGGLMSQRTYPYRGRKCRCKQARRKRVVKVKTFQCITPYELEMQRWMALRGPIVVSINAAMLKTYRSGIIRASSFRCPASRVNQVVCIVGYGYQRRKPYWILKNSWGRKWGENRRCSASWAFGCVANIESLSYIKTKQLKVLSEQELLDCDRYDKGCSGGFPFTGFYAVQRLGGLMSQRTYPYRGRKCRCKQARRKRVVKVKTFQCITPYELEMQRWVALRGPIVVSINAAMLKTYRHGIIRASSFRCSARRVHHVVCIVGYGYQRRKPYWILKNSWGRKWGENGYFRMYRGEQCCGVNRFPLSAVL